MSNKKNRTITLCLIIIVGLLLTGCGNSNVNGSLNNPSSNDNIVVESPTPEVPNTDAGTEEGASELPETTKAMVEAMISKVPQPAQVDVTTEMVSDLYHLDPALLAQFTIKMPMMNIKTNEIAILQAKDANDIPAIEEAVKQRAADVQKQFETYLPDQYENAKNYKVVIKENYVLFVISDQADDLVNEFNSFFE